MSLNDQLEAIERKTGLKAFDELILRVTSEQGWSHVSLFPTVDNHRIVIQLGLRTIQQYNETSPKLYGFKAFQTVTIPNHGFYEDGAWSIGKLTMHLVSVWGIYLA